VTDDTKDEPQNEIEVVLIEDPIWDRALHVLEASGDASILAKLLRNGEIPPTWALKQIGIMLSPPSGYIGPELKPHFGKRTRAGEINKLVEKRKIRDCVLKLAEKYGKLEAAVDEVMQQENLSRATIFNILKIDDKEAVFQSLKLLGEDTNSLK
jgi:hypothetical protein